MEYNTKTSRFHEVFFYVAPRHAAFGSWELPAPPRRAVARLGLGTASRRTLLCATCSGVRFPLREPSSWLACGYKNTSFSRGVFLCSPKGNRTPVYAVRGHRPTTRR